MNNMSLSYSGTSTLQRPRLPIGQERDAHCKPVIGMGLGQLKEVFVGAGSAE